MKLFPEMDGEVLDDYCLAFSVVDMIEFPTMEGIIVTWCTWCIGW